MSISLEPLSSPPIAERALALLKGKDNPFEVLAAGQRADDDYFEIHVPELHQRERGLLFEIIDSYRLDEYADSDALRKTRVVTIQGARGSGKTHLLQSLVARADKPQLIVRPAFLEPNLPFEEYLLSQLRTALAQQTEFHVERPLDAIARGLTRRLLRQALYGASPTDRLFALSDDRPMPLGLLWGGGEEPLRRLDALLEQLNDPAARDLSTLMGHFGLSTRMAYRLIDSHLRLRETGSDPIVQMRRLFYSALARSVLFADHDAVPRFFSDDHQPDPTAANLRIDRVQGLLHVLLETCTLSRLPVVFAFDNFERLFAPQNQFDGALIRGFLNNLSQAVDGTRGLLFLLFVESSLFADQVVPQMDDFARNRLEQGVPVPGQGPVYLIRLSPPSSTEIETLVHSRIRPLLSEMEELDSLPSTFPFSPEFMTGVVGLGSVSLRTILYALRDEYNRVVYVTPPDPDDKIVKPLPPPPPLPDQPDWPALLELVWNRSFQNSRKWVESMSHHDLHNCLGGLLQACQPLTLDQWDLHKVIPVLTVGEHYDYGVVSVLAWKVHDGANVKGPQSLRVAIGFLLAAGTGMAHDLRAKFDFFRDKQKGVRLVILTTKEGDPMVDALPPGTRGVWDEESDNHWRTELRHIEEIDIRRILTFQDLLERVEETAGQPPPAEAVRDLLHKKLNRVFPLLRPPGGETIE
jgi:hypothetical protein